MAGAYQRALQLALAAARKRTYEGHWPRIAVVQQGHQTTSARLQLPGCRPTSRWRCTCFKKRVFTFAPRRRFRSAARSEARQAPRPLEVAATRWPP